MQIRTTPTRPRPSRNARTTATAALLALAPAARATVYTLANQTIDLGTAHYTAADTLDCSDVTFTASSPATLPAALNLIAGTTTLSNKSPVTFTGPLSGTAALHVTGTGTLTLSAPSPSFTGPLMLYTFLRLTDPLAAGPASAPHLGDYGILDLAGTLPERPINIHDELLNSDPTTPITLGPSVTAAPSQNLTLGGPGDLTFASPFPGSDFYKLDKTGTGTLTYSTRTTYGGVIVGAGTLRLGTPSPFTGVNDSVTLDPGATLDLNGYSSFTPISGASSGGTVVNDNTQSPSSASLPSRGITAAGGAGTLTLASPLNGPQNLSKIGTGTLLLSDAAYTYSGTLTITGGTLRLNHPDAATGPGSAHFLIGFLTSQTGRLDLNGYPAPAGHYFFGAGSPSGADALVNDNTSAPSTLDPGVTFDTSTSVLGGNGDLRANIPVPPYLLKIGPGTLTLTQPQHFASLSLTAGTLRLAPSSPPTPTQIDTLTLPPTGATLDLSTSPLLLDPTNTPPSTLRSYLLNHQLSSSSTDSTHALGYVPSPSSLLVQLTLIGDANLDGVINADDYALLDQGFASGGSYWWQGDFNYDGVVDASDYLLIDTTLGQAQGFSPGFLAQRESQFGAQYVQSLLSAVPEPLPLSSILYPLSSLLLTRQRRRTTPPRPR